MDAGFPGADLIGARGYRVQAPARVPQHHVQHHDDEQRPQDFAVPPCAENPREPRTAGRATGVPCDIVSVSPFTRNNVPSVVTKDGTRSRGDDAVDPADQPPRRSAREQRDQDRSAGLLGEMHERTGPARRPCRRKDRSRRRSST